MAAFVDGFGHRHFAGCDRDLRAAGVDPGHARGIHAGGRGGSWAGILFFACRRTCHAKLDDWRATPLCGVRADCGLCPGDPAGTGAVGAPEETEAIAVIGSEETGAISLAVAAKIERDLTVEQLRERLGELLRRYVPPSTLPTPITNGSEGLEAADEETPRSSFSRTVDSRAKPGTGRGSMAD